MPQVGDIAPDFTASTDSGEEITLSSLRGQKVILYFYPKDNTSGCTAEACDFRDNHDVAIAKNAVVLGVSPDSVKSHQGFKAKHDLPFTLIADPNKEIVIAYGVYREKKQYGRAFMGVVRSTFVIDESGVITHAYDKVKVKGHVDAILAEL